MTLAQTLLRLWSLRVWLGVGAFLALISAIASFTLGHSEVYSAASAQMIVDAPVSAIGDPNKDMTPYMTRAVVFARLMTTPAALQYIGRAAGIPGNLIGASGPIELAGDGAPQAMHVPTTQSGQALTSSAPVYKLNLLQNPQLPTVDIYAQAPTTRQAIALANGAVSGFGAYIHSLDSQSGVPPTQRLAIREAGSATGGVVDPGASKSLALIVFVLVFALWCLVVLFVTNLRSHLRNGRANRPADAANGDFAAANSSPYPDSPFVSYESAPRPLADDVAEYAFRNSRSGNGTGGPDEVAQRMWVAPDHDAHIGPS